MNVLVIGCGSIGRRHIATLLALGCAVTGRDESESARAQAAAAFPAARFFGIGPFADEPKPDAVLICTPASTHEAVAEQLLVGGYHGPVFCEKPLALNSKSRIFSTWPHPTTMVGYNLRWHAAAASMRRALPTDGALTLECDSRQWPGAWYAGLLDECSHEIDLALYLGAPPRVTRATLTEHQASLQLGDGWSIQLHDRAYRYQRRWDVFGPAHGSCHVFTDPRALGQGMYVAELRHFLEAAQTGVPTACPFADGLRVLDVCDQARKAAA